MTYFKILFCFTILLGFSFSKASDVVGVLNKKCEISYGFIFNVNPDSVYLLSLDGSSKIISRAEITTLLIYKNQENPIRKIHFDNVTNSNFKQIYLTDSKQPTFSGWPIGFMDNLLFFIDTTGKSQVIDIYNIHKIRSRNSVENTMPQEIEILSVNEKKYAIGDSSITCDKVLDQYTESLKSSVEVKVENPTQVLIDLIRIQDFLSSLENGYRRLESLEERTHFYLKPYLFDRTTRLGLFSLKTDEDPLPNSPIYFKWSSGEAFRFQNQSQIGSGILDNSPNIASHFIFSSEMKSHIFHGEFLGNLAALSVGSSFYAPYFSLDKLNTGIVDFTGTFVSENFNYMTLMGIDYENISLSFGTIYPITLIKTNLDNFAYFREVLSTQVSPIYRVRYKSMNWETSLLYTTTERDLHAGVNDSQVNIDYNSSVVGVMSELKMRTHNVRLNIHYQLSESIKSGFSVINFWGNYAEKYVDKTENKIQFQARDVMIFADIQFGIYLALKGYFVLSYPNHKFELESSSTEYNKKRQSFGGALEFIF